MATVTMELTSGRMLTKEQRKELREASKLPVNYTEDAPKLSDKELSEFRPAHPELFRPKKAQITLRVDADILAGYKATGKGYMTRMNADLREMAMSKGII